MKLSEHTSIIKCSKCGGNAKQVISLSVFRPFIPVYDEQTDLNFTGHRQKAKTLQRAGFEEVGMWTKEKIEERKWNRKEKRKKKKRMRQDEGEVGLESKKRAEAYFRKRGR